MVKHTKELQWKKHPVNLAAVDDWARKTLGESYCGNSADSSLKLHFTEVPSEDMIAEIDLKWEELDDEEHEMCASYKSREDKEADVAAKKESAKAKLAKLGLDADEIAALLG